MESNSNSSVWNFDEARMRDLHEHMVWVEEGFENWNLELINKKLQTIELIVSGADWGKNEWEKIEKDLAVLEKIKREIDKSKNDDDDNSQKDKIKFYNEARKIYKIINKKMQNKGFFFRVRDDVDGL